MLTAANTTIDFAEEYKNLAYASGPFVVFDKLVSLETIAQAIGSQNDFESYPADKAIRKIRMSAMLFPDGYQQFAECWGSEDYDRSALFLSPVYFAEFGKDVLEHVTAEVRPPQQFPNYLNEIIRLSQVVADKFMGRIDDENSAVVLKRKNQCISRRVTFNGCLMMENDWQGFLSRTDLRIKQAHSQMRLSLG